MSRRGGDDDDAAGDVRRKTRATNGHVDDDVPSNMKHRQGLDHENDDDAAEMATATAELEMASLMPTNDKSLSIHPAQENSPSVVVVDLDGICRVRAFLYTSHAVAQLAEISWQFGLVIFFAALCDYQSLFLITSYGLGLHAAVCVASARVGRWVDAERRLPLTRWLLAVENGAVVTATVLCFVLLSWHDGRRPNHDENSDSAPSSIVTETPIAGAIDNATTTNMPDDEYNDVHGNSHVPRDAVSIVLLLLIFALGAVAQVMDQAFTVAIERDWVVVIAQSAAAAAAATAAAPTTTTSAAATTTATLEDHDGTLHENDQEAAVMFDRNSQRHDDECEESTDSDKKTVEHETDPTFHSWLSHLNVSMKQIDLSAKVIAPVLTGLLVSTFGNGSNQTTAFQLRWASLVIGAMNITALAIEWTCTLAIYRMLPLLAYQNSPGQPSLSSLSSKASQTRASYHDAPTKARCYCTALWPDSYDVYFAQPGAAGGLALALLYLNPLTFGNGIMTTYLMYRGLALHSVGVLRGLAAAVGLLGTVAYHCSVQRVSLVRTGQWSIVYELACLMLCCWSMFVPTNNVIAIIMLVGGVCASRIGLWVFDIAITQMQQEQVPDTCRGTVGGVQKSLNAAFTLLSFALGIVCPDPKDFAVYVFVATLAVGTAATLYYCGIVRRSSK